MKMLLLFFLAVVCASNPVKAQDYEFALGGNVLLKFTVRDSRHENGGSSKIIKAYEKGSFRFSEIGEMETLRIAQGEYGDGFQWIFVDDGDIIVQQSFGDGKYLVISKLRFKRTKRKTLKLVGYAEEHVDRFSEDKDFSEIAYEIPENIFFGDVDSEFVYGLHRRGIPDERRTWDGAFFWKQDKIDFVEIPSDAKNYIYAPKKIYVHDIDSLDFIPVYQFTSISERRSWKYGDIVYDKKVLIKRTGNIASLFKKYDSYEVFDKRLRSEGISIFPAFLVNLVQEKRAEAKKYSEKDLDEGARWLEYLSFNLLDFMPKITEFGYYDIYMSERGLDSNHIVFEIKKQE